MLSQASWGGLFHVDEHKELTSKEMTITLIISKEVINKDTNDVMLMIVQLETKT